MPPILLGRIDPILTKPPDGLPGGCLLFLPLCDFSEPAAEEVEMMGGMVVDFSEEVVSVIEMLRVRPGRDEDPGRADKAGTAAKAAPSAELVGEVGLHTFLTFWRNIPPSFRASKFMSSEDDVWVDSFSLMIVLSTSIQPMRAPESGNLRVKGKGLLVEIVRSQVPHHSRQKSVQAKLPEYQDLVILSNA